MSDQDPWSRADTLSARETESLMPIDDHFPLERKVIAVDGVPFASVDHGNVDPIVLLHGHSDVDLPVAQMCWPHLLLVGPVASRRGGWDGRLRQPA